MVHPRMGVTVLVVFSVLQLAVVSASASSRVPPTPNFLAARSYQVGYTSTLVTADFNGDGYPDFAFPAFEDVDLALGNGDGTLGTVIKIPSGFEPNGLATADFNGDGLADLAVTHLYTNVLSVLLGNGDGSFATPVDYTVADDLISIAAGDLNGDGKPDIVVGNQLGPGSLGAPKDGHQALLVLLNNGDGSFGASTQYLVSGAPTPTMVVDVNGDGFADVIATLGFGNDSLAVWLSDAAGLLHGPKLFALSDYPLGFAVGYLNHDGFPDVVTVNGDGNVNVFLSQGRSGFAPEVSYPSAVTFPIAVTVGDLVEGDGPDLAVIGQLGALSVLPNAGDATFGSATVSSAGTSNSFLVATDLNADGHLDVVTAAQQTGITVLLGNGSGQFRTAPVFAVPNGPVGLRVGDFNADGEPDLAVLDNYDENVGGDVAILLWTGPDTFALASDVPAGRNPRDVAVADFNNDGAEDLVIADGENDTQNLTIALGNGDGTFRKPGSTGLVNAPLNVATADFNGDGNADIAVGISNTANQTAPLTIVLGNGDGTFQTPVTYAGAGGSPTAMVATDFNKDGRLDLVVLGEDESVLDGGLLESFLGNGDGTFQAAHSLRLGFRTGGLAVGDVNGDHAPDLAMVDQDASVAVSLGLGNGSFGPLTQYPSGPEPATVALGDMNGDGIVDLVVGHSAGSVGIFPGNGDGTFGLPTFYANGDGSSGFYASTVVLGRFHGGNALDIAVVEFSQFDVAVLKELPPE